MSSSVNRGVSFSLNLFTQLEGR